jgi:hypothetical protein
VKFVILIWSNPESRALWEKIPPENRVVGLRDYAALNDDLEASGELVANAALGEPSAGRRVTARDRQAIVSDGPYPETKEFLAGVYVLECPSMDRAVEVAARIPEAALGLVEVRPTRTLDSFVAGEQLGPVEAADLPR